jgi:hypothetical protein
MFKRLVLISLLLIAVSSQLGYACNGYKGKEPTTDALDVVSDILKAPCKLLETALSLGAPLTDVLQVPATAHASKRKPKAKRAADKKRPKKETPRDRKETVIEAPRTPVLEPSIQDTAPPETTADPQGEEPFPEVDTSVQESTDRPSSTAPEINANRSEPKPPAIESGPRTGAPKRSKRKRYRTFPYRKAPCWRYW